MRQTLRALRSPNYRLFFIGQAVSLIGTWMQSVAMQWLIFSKTHRTDLLGITVFCSLVPGFLFGPFAGVIVDRFDKRRLLLVTQAIQMAEAVILTGLVYWDAVQIWHIIVLSIIIGCVGAFDMPARQAFMVHLVEDREDLSNAIALNSSQFNLARLIGPAIAGFTYKWAGPSMCFLINALSFLAVILALYMVKGPRTSNPEARGNIVEQVREGAAYVGGFVPVRALIILLAVVSFLSGAQSVMMPVLAAKQFHGEADTYGLIQAAIGGGALVSALMLASRHSVLGLGRWLVVSVSLYGSALVLLSFVKHLPIGLVLLTLVGGGVMAHMAATNTLVQTVIDDKMRGRVMAFYTMAFTGTMPFGSLLAGYVADRLDRAGHHGVSIILAAIGILLLICAVVFMRALPKLKEAIRPVYLEKGILTA